MASKAPEATGTVAAVRTAISNRMEAGGRGQDGDQLQGGGAQGAVGRTAIRCRTEVLAIAVRTGGQLTWRYGGRGHQHDISESAHAEQKAHQK